VKVDLSDVVGSPGLARPASLAEELERELDTPWTQLAETDGLFLIGHLDGTAESAGEAAGAFAASPRTLRQVVDVVLRPGRGTGTDDVVSVLESPTGRHEVRQQLLRGAPVVGATYVVHHGDRGGLTITGRPLGDLIERDPGPRPSVPDKEVRAAMVAALDLPRRTKIELDLVVFPVDGGGQWAYRGKCVLSNPPADLRIFLAATGDLPLLLCYDVACSALYGEADVYWANPARSPNPRRVLLEDLGPEPADCLTGSMLTVAPHRGVSFTSAGRDYRVGPEIPAFDEVSAYANVQSAARWFARILGPTLFTEHPFRPLKVVTGDRTVRSAVGMYIPQAGEIRLSDARRNPARSADIVFHEFAHAVADRICRINRSAGPEAKILSEGFADYAAASAFDDPRFGDYVMDAPNGARNCSDPGLRFPTSFDGADEPYRSGAVWSAVLWDLRSGLGTEIADALVFNSLSYLTPNCTIEEARAALVKTDRDLFPAAEGGRHEDAIEEMYRARY
jgi:hypothetical protein